jgi:hypothetical protein
MMIANYILIALGLFLIALSSVTAAGGFGPVSTLTLVLNLALIAINCTSVILNLRMLWRRP